MHVVVSLGNALHVGSKSCLYEFTELNFLSVGSQLPPRTLITLIDWLIDCIKSQIDWTSNARWTDLQSPVKLSILREFCGYCRVSSLMIWKPESIDWHGIRRSSNSDHAHMHAWTRMHARLDICNCPFVCSRTTWLNCILAFSVLPLSRRAFLHPHSHISK